MCTLSQADKKHSVGVKGEGSFMSSKKQKKKKGYTLGNSP